MSALAFLVAVIGCQVAYAGTAPEQARYNSALTSVCFMVLLGFMDDVLDLPWRAKIILPTVASLPLLVTYSGSTSVVVPRPLRGLLLTASAGPGAGVLTPLGALLDAVPSVTVRGPRPSQQRRPGWGWVPVVKWVGVEWVW